jgi:hypothetical protein
MDTASMLLLLLVILTQSPAPATTTPPSSCSAPEHRQFDFWIGEWEVRAADGRVLGWNRITAILGNCALQEEWTSAGGKVRGVSINAFDPADHKWHQAWVDTGPSRLALAGGLVDGRMVMEERTPANGTSPAQIQRITWTPLPGGRLRQQWEVSTDDGRKWKSAFDGYYSQRGR